LTLLAVLATILSVPGSMQSQSAGNPQDPIVATWLITVQADTDQPFLVYETYAPAGALSAIDNEAPSSEETVAVGSWRKVAPRKYYEDQWQFLYDGDGNFVGTWIGHIEDDLDASGNNMLPSPFTYEIIAPDGTVIDSGSGSSYGSKMPPPKGPQPNWPQGVGLRGSRKR
jgi:hypothetical protein